ncbi:uncharacterized protein LOC120412528 isoform X1 [Culex pipiens pallens]|uniref:uncharacterized protein LOC120412528 isoform X1 n=2 Tax=Culex pipiens pallens TaxID=42434 RepID=UPI0019544CB0|nr:uncharacterized protein LOC120412528 isoform X1 [Culex pipiens pallens]
MSIFSPLIGISFLHQILEQTSIASSLTMGQPMSRPEPRMATLIALVQGANRAARRIQNSNPHDIQVAERYNDLMHLRRAFNRVMLRQMSSEIIRDEDLAADRETFEQYYYEAREILWRLLERYNRNPRERTDLEREHIGEHIEPPPLRLHVLETLVGATWRIAFDVTSGSMDFRYEPQQTNVLPR